MALTAEELDEALRVLLLSADDARRAEHYHGMTPHAVMKDKTEKQEKMLLLLLLMRAIHRL